jgi:hypothetical protein
MRDYGVGHADPQHHRIRFQLRDHALVDHSGLAELLHHGRHGLACLYLHFPLLGRLRKALEKVVNSCVSRVHCDYSCVARVMAKKLCSCPSAAM